MKVKLKATQRENKRYLLLEGVSEKEAKETILEYLGVLGWGKANPRFLRENRELILVIDRKALEDVRAAFELSKKKIIVRKVSGTINGLVK